MLPGIMNTRMAGLGRPFAPVTVTGTGNATGIGTANAVTGPSPLYSFNFAAMSAFPAGFSYSRSDAVATYFDATGTLQTAAANVPRFGYDMWAKKPFGYICEGSATNSIRNNTMVGAVVGSPGTLPTNWAITGSNGLSRSVIATGTQNGIKYIDIRIFGTSTAGTETDIFWDTATGIASGNSTYWAVSSFLQLVGGSSTNISYLAHDLDMQSSVPADLGFVGNGNNIYSNLSPSGLLRFSDRFVTNNASVATVRPGIRVFPSASGVAVDITLRIGMPQGEVSAAGATSVIATSGSAATRQADNATMTGALATLVGSTSFAATSNLLMTNSNAAFIGAASANYPGWGFVNPNLITSNGYSVNQLLAAETDTSLFNVYGLSVGGGARALTMNGGSRRGGVTGTDTTLQGLGVNLATDAAQGYPILGNMVTLNLYNGPLTTAQLETATDGTNTIAWGDSLTAGTGSYSPGVNFGYVGWLSMLTTGLIINQGVGGQSAAQITTRCVADTVHISENVILEMGRNDVGGSVPNTIAQIQSCVSHIGHSRYVVLTVINSTAENSASSGTNLTNYNWILSLNAQIASTFPNNYVDVRSAIVTASGGANDAPPATYMFGGQVHPNDAGYQVMATQVANFGHSKGWPGY